MWDSAPNRTAGHLKVAPHIGWPLLSRRLAADSVVRALPSRGQAAKDALDELCSRCVHFHDQARELLNWDRELFEVVPNGMLSSDEESEQAAFPSMI